MKMRQEEEEKVRKKPDRRSFKQKSLAERFQNSVSSPPNDNKDSEGSGMDSSTPEESKMSPDRRQEGNSLQSSPSDFDNMLLSNESEVSAHADIAENFAEDDQEEDPVKQDDDMRSGLGAQQAEEQKGSDDDSDEDDDDDYDYDKYLDDIEN